MSTLVLRATKGSALTWVEADDNFTTLNNDKIESIVEDTTPQLGGDLDTNGNAIYDSSGPLLIGPDGLSSPRVKVVDIHNDSLEIIEGDRVYVASTHSLTKNNLGRDLTTSERVRGNVSLHKLDLNGYDYTGSGVFGSFIGTHSDMSVINTGAPGAVANEVIALNCPTGVENDAVINTLYGIRFGGYLYDTASVNNYIAFQADTADFNANTTYSFKCDDENAIMQSAGPAILSGLTYPTDDGTANQVITTDGSGNLSFTTPSISIVEDTTPQLGGDLDVTNHNIIATDGIIRLGSGSHSSGRGKGLYYDDIITQNTTDRTYAIYKTSSCTATVDVNSTARVRGDVSTHNTDLDGHNANTSSHYHFGGNYMFPGIYNSGTGGGDVGVYGGLLIEPSINDDVSITGTLYGLTVSSWHNSSGTINNYVGVAVNPPNVIGSKYSLQCWDDEAILYNAGAATLSGLTYPTDDGTANQVITTDGSGNLSFSDASSSVDTLTDVNITSLADGDALVYNATSSKWENSTVLGDVSTALATILGE